jgi:hypothetical protein
MTNRVLVILTSCVILCAPVASAQRGGQQGQAANQPGGQPGSQPTGGNASSLQGLSWANKTWDDNLGFPQIRKRVVACYTLVYGNSATLPFLLQPAKTTEQLKSFRVACKVKNGKPAEDDPEGKKQCAAQTAIDVSKRTWCPCAHLTSDQPVLMGQNLVIGIDVSQVRTDRMKVLNLNVTNQQGNPINPTPVRPSFSNSVTSSTNLAGGPYYLAWPNEIPGESNATINVNVVYTPPVPGEKWFPATFYPAGSVVISAGGDGHYYSASVGGVSAEQANQAPAFRAAAVAQIRDGTITWIDSGNAAPQGANGGGPGNAGQANGSGTSVWLPSTNYNRGQSVYDPYNGHYYLNLSGAANCPVPGGAATTPCGTSGLQPSDPFSLPTISDGTVVWADRGPVLPGGAATVAWSPATRYDSGAWVGPENGRYFQAVQPATAAGATPATSGPGPFVFPLSQAPATVSDGEIVWQDAGTTAPGVALLWVPNTSYNAGAAVATSNGHYYTTTRTGRSGSVPAQPNFGITVAQTFTPEAQSAANMQIVWEDIGTAAPSSVANGQPADQVVSLLNLPFSESHSLSYYNLASGVVYSGVNSRSFGLSCTSSGTPPVTTCKAIQTGTSPTVDPVLLFTFYPIPWDAERRCPNNICLGHFKTNPPGLSFGLSLSSPASSFHVGASFELLRNVQIFAGYNWSKQATLPPPGTSQPTMSSGTPVTVQKFYGGPSAGLTLNISGFIQGLFGGGSKSTPSQ